MVVTVSVVLAIAGVVLVILGIVGGGISGQIGLPKKLSSFERTFAILGGLLLLIAAYFLDQPSDSQQTATTTSTPMVQTDVRTTPSGGPDQIEEPERAPLTIATQIAPTASTETNSQRVVSNCPTYQLTGQGESLDLSINVPSGEIVLIDAWTFDTTSSGVFVTITGPYQGEHTIVDGAYCGGIDARANYQPLLEQRRSQLSEPYTEINLP
jgi:hypothetical protein